eukprot:TRINITY_DN25880_c0_g3_i1.p1 TRINITY_DN25880_c0_g3~~TRINITY_DN25880_c0_g3_i1.p1  ORF type:complete len:1226 (+),score=150.55 TRINITY_DN25880_c0_g3_i1:312-3680(+)
MIKTLGLVAADSECYELFQDLFDAVIQRRHGESCLKQPHRTDLDKHKLTTLRADSSGKYVLSVQVRAARDLAGVQFPPAVSLEKRREVEASLVKSLSSMTGTAKGSYFSLAGSSSYGPMPAGMTPAQEAELTGAKQLFQHPDSTTALCSGVGRHWPDGRGVFVSESKRFFAWINEEEHLRVVSVRTQDAIQEAFIEVAECLAHVESSLRSGGGEISGFAWNERLGFLTSCPSNLGTSMRFAVIIQIPLLAQNEDLGTWCERRRLVVRAAVDDYGARLKGVVELSNRDRLGFSEVEVVNHIVESVRILVRIEQYLESGAGADMNVESLASAVQMDCNAGQESADIKGIRSRMQVRLVEALGTGALEKAFAAVALEQAARRESDLEAYREKMKWALEEGLANGNLERALGEFGDRAGAQDVEIARLKIKSMLEAGLNSGLLEDSLQRRLRTEVPRDVEAIRIDMKAKLEEGLESGLLERALEVHAGRCNGTDSGEEVNSVRLKMKGLLEAGLESGALECALEARAARAAASKPDGLEAIRLKMKEHLETGLATGSLERALSGGGGGLATVAAQDLEAIRLKMKGHLEAGLQNGALENALAGNSTSMSASDELEAIRLKMKTRLEEGFTSGALLAALEGRAPKIAAGTASTIDSARSEIRSKLEESLNTGLLEQAITEEQQQHEMKGVRERIRGVLQTGLESGTLETAFANLTATKAPTQDVEAVRKRLAGLFTQALDNGMLQKSFDGLSQTQSCSKDVNELRSRMQETLDMRLRDGTLCTVLATEWHPEAISASGLDEIRGKMKLALENALEDGSLERSLRQNASSAQAQVIEETRQKMRGLLMNSLNDGSFERVIAEVVAARPQSPPGLLSALAGAAGVSGGVSGIVPPLPGQSCDRSGDFGDMHALPAVAGDSNIDLTSLCVRVRDGLMAGVNNGSLDDWLSQGGIKGTPGDGRASLGPELVGTVPPMLPPERQSLAISHDCSGPSEAIIPRPNQASAAEGHEAVVLESVSNIDRRIGSLMAAIEHAKKRMLLADEQGRQLEGEIANARAESVRLDQELEVYHRLHHEADIRSQALADSQKKLTDEVDGKTLKLRHAHLDMEPNLLYTARSDLSTACTVTSP